MGETELGAQHKGTNIWDLMERWNDWVSKKSSSSTLKLAHDLKCMQCESRTMSKMMSDKEWLCNLSKMFFLNRSNPLFTNCTKGEHKSPHPHEGVPTSTSNGPKRGINQNNWHLSLQIKMENYSITI